MSRLTVAAWLLLSLAALGSAGCGPKGKPADPAAARTTLGRVLDAWQKGDSLETFQKTSSGILLGHHFKSLLFKY